MAELSTLSPSPPALGDPHVAPSIPPSSSAQQAINHPVPESAMEKPSPMSSLYNDKALTGNTPAAQSGGSPLTPHPPLSPTKLTADSPISLLVHEASPQREESPGKDAETVADVMKQETSDPPAAERLNTETATPAPPSEPSSAPPSEPSAPSEGPQASPSPDLNPGPNLYPNVHVTHNPNPVMDDGKFTANQPQIAAASNATPAAAASIDSTAAVEEKPQPLQQEEIPQSLPPPPPPLSPKPATASEATKAELPSTPTRAEPPSPSVPLILEPDSPFPLPKPRPAPDTLSYLESASIMSGTLESLSGLGEDGSSVGSDSEVNGMSVRRTDKYGFLGGNQYSESGEKDVRVEVARQREVKWLDMFYHWDKWVKHRFQKVKLRCRKGIPSSLRSKAWQLLSNSQELLDANPGKFEELEREPGEAKWLDIIEKDLHRQFPFHEMFAARGGHGQQDLYRILKAYTIYRPEEGYCQAQAPVAAVLLMHMPAEQAFWCLVQICEKYLPGYYSAGLEAIQLDGEIFFSLLRRTCPMAYRHLKKFKIDPILYMTEWFMCIFSRTLPWASVLRVWDMFFCEGVKIVFRVGLVLLKQMLGSVDKLRELQGMYETMERLRNIAPDAIKEEILVQEIIILPVTESLIERESNNQVRKWRESRGELTHQPARRLHGTRALYEHKRRAASISSGGSFSFLGSQIPPPGPLRASSSLLSLPGFRRSKAPFHSQAKKGSFSGPSGVDSRPVVTSSPERGPSHKPPIPPGAGQKAPAPQVRSPLVRGAEGSSQAPEDPPAHEQPAASALTQSTAPPPNTLSPAPKIVSEQITPTLPSPTANNSTLTLIQDSNKEASPATEATTDATTDATTGEEEVKKKRKSKDDKKKEKEDDKKKMKERKEKEKADKERLRKEKERLEKEKKKGGKKKDKGGGEAEDRNGGAAAREA